jgi:hypothetical protein
LVHEGLGRIQVLETINIFLPRSRSALPWSAEGGRIAGRFSRIEQDSIPSENSAGGAKAKAIVCRKVAGL